MCQNLTPGSSMAGPFDTSELPTAEPGNPAPAAGLEAGDVEAVGVGAADADPALADWKDELRADFERWLATLENVPDEQAVEPDGEPGGEDAPDLFTFYEELAALNAEARKANRRSAEAISQWADTLARFEKGLEPLRTTVADLAAARAAEGRMSNERCLMLVEVLDRLQRLAQAFATTPATGGWWRGNDGAWRRAWAAQREGFEIVMGHLEGLLRKEGVTRLRAQGKPFDPSVMMAIAVVGGGGDSVPTVVEEVAGGYLRDDRLLRPAQVKVTGGASGRGAESTQKTNS